jgi:hypothetical protein
VLLADRVSGRLAVNLGRLGAAELTTLDWADAESREVQRLDAEALRLLYVALTRAEQELVLPVPARPEGKGFYQYLGALLGAPTDVLTVSDPERREGDAETTGLALPGAEAGETFDAWRGRQRALLRDAGAPGDGGQPPSDVPEVGDRGRAARQRVAAAALARAALLEVDLGHPGEAPAVVLALGSSRGARPEVVAAATRLLRRALADPVVERARHATWVARDMPVAALVEGAVVEDRLDLVFEEPGGLVVVRVDAGEDAARPAMSPEMLAPALGRPVREALVLSLTGA